jgi:N-acetylneuraminic acid mutarotase
MKRWFSVAALAACLLAPLSAAQAHFIFLLTKAESTGQAIHVYFAEEAAPDPNPGLLDRLAGLEVWQISEGQEPKKVDVAKGKESLTGKLDDAAKDSVFISKRDLGVMTRGEVNFGLQYYAKTGPAAPNHPAWKIDTTKQLKLDVVPTITDKEVQLKALLDGKPTEGVEIAADGPSLGVKDLTNAEGIAKFKNGGPGVYSFRAKFIDKTPGEKDGKKYPELRHYTTVAFEIPGATNSEEKPAAPKTADAKKLPKIPHAITSFGGAVLNGDLYIYGGNMAGAHSYAHDQQGKTLQKLALKGGEWTDVLEGPGLQGLALVPFDGKLYRIGGFTAKNKEGEDKDLWSQAEVAAFDPAKKAWIPMPPLPEPRSSHDAAVIGNTVYVVGGWSMQGSKSTEWHTTGWKMDLSSSQPKWEAIAALPGNRRALAAAEHNGKLYVIGGMLDKGGPTTTTVVYDPKTDQWSDGPSLLGDGMNGFGASAFATGGNLYVSTHHGDLQRLSGDGSAWETIAKLPTDRFFHRMLPIDEDHLVIVGGASMKSGKYEEVEVIHVD